MYLRNPLVGIILGRFSVGFTRPCKGFMLQENFRNTAVFDITLVQTQNCAHWTKNLCWEMLWSTHTHTHTHTHIHTHTDTQTHTHTKNTHTINIHTHINTRTHTYTHIHTYAHLNTHKHTHAHTYTHIHTRTHTHTWKWTQRSTQIHGSVNSSWKDKIIPTSIQDYRVPGMPLR